MSRFHRVKPSAPNPWPLAQQFIPDTGAPSMPGDVAYFLDKKRDKLVECDVFYQENNGQRAIFAVQLLCPKCGNSLLIQHTNKQTISVGLHGPAVEVSTRAVMRQDNWLTVGARIGCDYYDSEITGVPNLRGRCGWRARVENGVALDD